MSDITGLWICFLVVSAALWLLWRTVWPDWMGAFWLAALVLALALFVTLPVVAAPRPTSHWVDLAPQCEGLEFAPVRGWVDGADIGRLVSEQLDVCALHRRGPIRSVAAIQALCLQLAVMYFPMLNNRLCKAPP